MSAQRDDDTQAFLDAALADSPVGEELLEARRRRRRDGDPRVSPAGRETLRRFVAGDLMGVFQAGLDADAESDPALSGSDPLDD